jgi:hypothetical protein
MNQTINFLDAVLPEEGTYCVVGIRSDGRIKQEFVHDIDEMAEKAQQLVDQKINAYFAVASFKEGSEKRTQENAQWMKSFWLDLDCGPNKPFPNQAAALEALENFRNETGLPEPTVVNSGNGIHVYWLLNHYISSVDWSPIARKLKRACEFLGLEADPAVTADEARILRIPTTLNFKNPSEPKEVFEIQRGEPLSASEFDAHLSQLDLPEEKKPRVKVDAAELSETAKALIGNRTSKFKKLVRKSVRDNGCNVIKHVVLNQADLEEPLWRAGLSIAWACEDRDEAIHLMSKNHPHYNPDDTLEKASQTKGPYTCEVIRGLAGELCTGCTQTCTSPIQLGSEVKRDVSELFAAPEESEVSEPGDGSISTQVVQQVLYKPPFPYFRAANGGVYKQDGTGDDAAEIPVYEYDLYPIKRIHDPNDGESIVFKLHLPNDAIREFTIPLKKLMATDSFRDFMGEQGVAATPPQMKEIMNYAIKFTKELQKLHKAHEARLQFGWSNDKEAFVVGNLAYLANKQPEHNPASSTTADLMRFFEPVGDLKKWRAAYNVLARPGMEALQLVAGAGFGSPLMSFTGLDGATINLISDESGTGKSTAGYLALSVWGDPKATALIADDTHLARLHRIGVMNNLPVMSDEMTNLAPDLLSQLIYSISQGRGRHRMEKDTNRERKNISSWQTMFLTNSNSSMMSKLSKAKARPDGEMMRLLEIYVKAIYVEGADVLFADINKNYGLAGAVYAQWLVDNRDKIPELLDKQRDRIVKVIGKRMEERFWLTTMTCNLVGLRIAQKLGLHDYDLDALEIWICEYLMNLREEVKSEIVQASSLVGEFLMDNSNGILAVGNRINPKTGDNIYMPSRSAKLVARFELDERLMYISKKAFREYCVDRQFTETQALKKSQEEGSNYQYTKTLKKRMMAGTAITAPGVDAHVFRCAPEEAEALFSAIEKATEKADNDA